MAKRILVVDDEPGMRKSLAIMLRREDYQVMEAASVPEAVGLLEADPYSLVIADLMMEPLNGLDLLALAHRRRVSCPIIIMTAFGTPVARTEALQLGAADFLEKPLHGPNLLLRIRELLRPEA